MINPQLNVKNNIQHLGMDLLTNQNSNQLPTQMHPSNMIQRPQFDAATSVGSSSSGSRRSNNSSRHRHRHNEHHVNYEHNRHRDNIRPEDSASSVSSSAQSASSSGSSGTSGSSSSAYSREKYARMSPERIYRKKKELLYKFDRLDKRGGFAHNFTIESDYYEMKTTYDRIVNDKLIDSSVKFQRKALVAFISGIEFLNGKVNSPAKLDGFSESIAESTEGAEYDDIFEELHEKYKGKSQMAPELRLIFSVVSAAVLYHFTNSIMGSFKQQAPDLTNIIESDPELKAKVAQATAKKMQQDQAQSGNSMGSGLMGMLGGLLGGGGNKNENPLAGMMQGMMSNMQNMQQQSQSQQYSAPQRNNAPPPAAHQEQEQEQEQANINNIMKQINQNINMEEDGSDLLSGVSSNLSDTISIGTNDMGPKIAGKRMMNLI